MDFAYSPKVQALRERVTAFMDAYVYPAEAVFEQQVAEGDRWQPTAVMEELKARARAEGLWNLFLPESERGAGLTNLEYAPLAEIMGRSLLGPEPFNCSAPDTGNMEVLVRYANEEQKTRWLEPLLRGEIRSAFAMTEPDVASSDATNMAARADREGDEWVINGRKWWTSGACDPRCKILIFMGLTNPDGPRHQQHSMILVPVDTPGVKIVGRCRCSVTTMRRMAMPKCCSTTFVYRSRTCCWVKAEALKLRRVDWGRGASITACARSAWLSGRSS